MERVISSKDMDEKTRTILIEESAKRVIQRNKKVFDKLAKR